ncbi:hypothetical protein ABKV19_002812 [Rosa sericea]
MQIQERAFRNYERAVHYFRLFINVHVEITFLPFRCFFNCWLPPLLQFNIIKNDAQRDRGRERELIFRKGILTSSSQHEGRHYSCNCVDHFRWKLPSKYILCTPSKKKKKKKLCWPKQNSKEAT